MPNEIYPTDRRPSVLIVGGAGFLGTELAHRLLQGGQRVRILDPLTSPESESNLAWLTQRHGASLQFERVHARQLGDVARALRGVRFAYHLVDGDEESTLNVLEAARASDVPVPVIVSSSLSVLHGPGANEVEVHAGRLEPKDLALRYGGLDERALTRDLEGRHGARLVTERRALSFAWHHGLPVAVLRFGDLLGATRAGRLPTGWVNDVVETALAGWPEEGVDPREVRDLLFVDDAVKALLAGRHKLGHLAGGLFHVCGGPSNAVSAADLLLRMGFPLHHPEVSPSRPHAASRAAWRVGSHERFKAATGWSPIVSATIGASRLHQVAITPAAQPLRTQLPATAVEEPHV